MVVSPLSAADDEVVNRSVGRRMLQRLGCSVVELSDGDEVEPLLRRIGQLAQYSPSRSGSAVVPQSDRAEHFDVIMLDIQMRRMNGDVLCRRLRELGLPTVIIAATGMHRSTQRHLLVG